MQWFWTDDLAVELVEHDRVAPERLGGWVERPVAYAAADESSALDVARLLLSSDGVTSAATGCDHNAVS
jgi:hypothetical protein